MYLRRGLWLLPANMCAMDGMRNLPTTDYEGDHVLSSPTTPLITLVALI